MVSHKTNLLLRVSVNSNCVRPIRSHLHSCFITLVQTLEDTGSWPGLARKEVGHILQRTSTVENCSNIKQLPPKIFHSKKKLHHHQPIAVHCWTKAASKLRHKTRSAVLAIQSLPATFFKSSGQRASDITKKIILKIKETNLKNKDVFANLSYLAHLYHCQWQRSYLNANFKPKIGRYVPRS